VGADIQFGDGGVVAPELPPAAEVHPQQVTQQDAYDAPMS
jgi:hypothetical protein